MAKPVLLQDDFSGGMKPDLPIAQLPKNAVRNMRDLVPGVGESPLTVRGGWQRTGATFSTTYAAAISFAPFVGSAQMVGIADTGAVFQVPFTGTGANTTRGTAQVPIQSPVFYRNVLYIPSDNGTTTIKSYDGSTNAAAAAGTPPTGQLCTTFKDHLVLARDNTNVNRIWFSSGGDAGTWDTAADGQWLDATYPVSGLATVRNMILAFAEQGVERIRGDIIPGVTGSDMVREPLPIPGCADPAAIVVADDVCYYANATGIYMTDGIGSVDLTLQGGIKYWWNDKLGGYDSSWTLSGGFANGRYLVTAHDGSTLKLTLVCDVARRAFYELSNIPAAMYATVPLGHSGTQAGGLYFAERDAPWLVDAQQVLNRSSSADDVIAGTQSDGNGTLRSVRLRTGYMGGSYGRKRFKKVYVRSAATTSDTITVKAFTSELIASGTEITVGTVTGSSATAVTRKKLALGRAVDGIVLDLTSSPSSAASLKILALEAEILPGESSR